MPEDIEEVIFSDYIEIIDINDDSYIFSVVAKFNEDNTKFKLYLKEDTLPLLIKTIYLYNDILFINLIDGKRCILPNKVKSVTVDDTRLNKNFSIKIAGILFFYDKPMALEHNLDESIFDKTIKKVKKKD